MYKISLIDQRAILDHSHSRNVVQLANYSEDLICTNPWSPVILKSGQNWLKQDNFQSISLLVFDIDNAPGSTLLSLEDAPSVFEGYKYVIGTTRNHNKAKISLAGTAKPPAHRYRVILFFSQPIDSIFQYKQLWSYYCTKFGLRNIADELKDVARYYLPCQNITNVQDGLLLSTDITNIEHKSDNSTTRPANASIGHETSENKPPLTQKTLMFISGLDDNLQNWHNKYVRAALDMKGKGYTYEEAEMLLTKASPQNKLDDEDIKQLEDVYERRESFFKPGTSSLRPDWPEMTRPTKAQPLPQPVFGSVKNLEYLISEVLNYKLQYDVRLARINKLMPEPTPFTEMDQTSVMYGVYQYKLGWTKEGVDTVLSHMAQRNSIDHFSNIFTAEPWDGQDHISALFNTLTLSDTESEERMQWYKEFFARWLRAMAAKYHEPGSQNNVLVFVGPQGVGKSRWFARLSEVWPDGFKEGPVDPGNKDHILCHIEKFLWHISELDSTTNNKDISALKDFLTKGSISERRAYARRADNGLSICSFAASVNSTDFLHDNSGNRRFLVLPVEAVNPKHNVNIRQVYAQASSEYISGLPWYFTREEIEATKDIANMYKYKDELTERLEIALKPGPDLLSLHEIIDSASNGRDNISYISSKAYRISIGNLLISKGFTPKNHSGRKVYRVDKQALINAAKRAVQPPIYAINSSNKVQNEE